MFCGDTIGLDRVLAGMRKYGEQGGEPFGPVHWAPSGPAEQLVAQGVGIADWRR